MRLVGLLAVIGAVLACNLPLPAAAGPTIEAIRSRDHLRCGVNTGLEGFAIADPRGVWSGLDADFCRALAAAVLGDAAKVRFTPLTPAQRFDALRRGQVDVLSRNTTQTLTLDTQGGFTFAPVLYYDGQGFMVAKAAGVDNINRLTGITVCVQQGTTSEANLTEYSRRFRLDFKAQALPDLGAAEAAFYAGRCQALTADRSALAGSRARRGAAADGFVILPNVISREPLAPVLRQDDPEWADLVRWTVHALVVAEEYEVTQKTVGAQKANPLSEVRRLLGTQPGIGKGFGLDDEWAARAIAAVGNYGEMFERNVGLGSRLKLERGANANWSKGGLMYAPPFR
jgi:general L-amino acid transport system substrate-binding protein